jgi:hypothetical protein
LAKLHDAKNADYAGEGGDPFRNFRKAEALGISASKGCLVRMGDKWSRIESLVNKGEESRKVKDESLVDTVKDLAVYALIWICLREQEVEAENEKRYAATASQKSNDYAEQGDAASPQTADWARPFDNNPVPGWRLLESFSDGSKTYARDPGGQQWHASPGTKPPIRCSRRVRPKDSSLDSRPCENNAEFLVVPGRETGLFSMPCREHLADSIPREEKREYVVSAI